MLFNKLRNPENNENHIERLQLMTFIFLPIIAIFALGIIWVIFG